MLMTFLFTVVGSSISAVSAVEAAEDKWAGMVGRVYAEPVFEYEVIHDIVYGRGLRRMSWGEPGGDIMDLRLEAYLPLTQSPDLTPAMMIFHGGGFQGGDKDYPQMREIADYYASRGWAVFSVNYRLTADHGSLPETWPPEMPRAIYPAGRDAKAAVRWLHANAENYRISRDHITVFGGSAGAMLSIMLGVSDPADYRSEIPFFLDPTLETTNIDSPANVQSVIAFWGGGNLLEALRLYDGHNRFDSSDAPTMLAHGTEDMSVPISGSEQVYQSLHQVGVPVEFHILPGRGHSAWNAKVQDGRTLFKAAFDFIVVQQHLPHS